MLLVQRGCAGCEQAGSGAIGFDQTFRIIQFAAKFGEAILDPGIGPARGLIFRIQLLNQVLISNLICNRRSKPRIIAIGRNLDTIGGTDPRCAGFAQQDCNDEIHLGAGAFCFRYGWADFFWRATTNESANERPDLALPLIDCAWFLQVRVEFR